MESFTRFTHTHTHTHTNLHSLSSLQSYCPKHSPLHRSPTKFPPPSPLRNSMTHYSQLQQVHEQFYTYTSPDHLVSSLSLPPKICVLIYNYWKLKRMVSVCVCVYVFEGWWVGVCNDVNCVPAFSFSLLLPSPPSLSSPPSNTVLPQSSPSLSSPY